MHTRDKLIIIILTIRKKEWEIRNILFSDEKSCSVIFHGVEEEINRKLNIKTRFILPSSCGVVLVTETNRINSPPTKIIIKIRETIPFNRIESLKPTASIILKGIMITLIHNVEFWRKKIKPINKISISMIIGLFDYESKNPNLKIQILLCNTLNGFMNIFFSSINYVKSVKDCVYHFARTEGS